MAVVATPTTNGIASRVANGTKLTAREIQAKFIQNRISNVEKHFGTLCTVLAGYTRKTARLRDKGDELSKALLDYAESETLNHTYKTSVVKYAENFASLQDYRNIEVNRLEATVLNPLCEYGTSCKKTREDLKAAFNAHAKEKKSQKSLESIRDRHPSDRLQIKKAMDEVERAGVASVRCTRALEEQMDDFEKRKLNDLRQVLQEFVNVEMAFHAKALETLTQCHKSLSIMNKDEDLEEFRNSLRPLSSTTRSRGSAMARTSSKTSLNSAGGSETTTPMTKPRRKSAPPIKPKSANQSPANGKRSTANHVTTSRANGRPPHSGANTTHNDDDDDDDDDDEYSDVAEDDSLEDHQNDAEYYKYNHR